MTCKTTICEAAWEALVQHGLHDERPTLREAFASDPERASRFSTSACGLHLDWSRHLVDDTTLRLLLSLGQACDIEGRRAAMFSGAKVNVTEGRAALHTALRNRSDRPVAVDGVDVMPDVRAVLRKMGAFASDVRDGTWRGFTGERVRDVVNIGIGGSDLGPHMVATALDRYRRDDLRVHYLSNLDGAHAEEVLRDLNPATTLVVVVSKTFSTQETLANAMTARHWLVGGLGSEEAVAQHFVAVSTHTERVRAFGIDPANMFTFWDWVGGRYSLWSAVGLSLAIVLGMETFGALLDGAFAMDEHFVEAPLESNLPVIMGLLGVWYADVLGLATHAVLPYDWMLRLLPAHLQQLEMESNGKRVDGAGREVAHPTCPIVWGGPGDNGQHAFYQLLHQGTQPVPADLLVALESQSDLPGHQAAVLANAFAQGEALMRGRTLEEAHADLLAGGASAADAERLAPHKVMPGDRPTSTLLYRRLDPPTLGALVALYEHKVFVQSVVWGTNPFDQWGVELGKVLAGRILEELEGRGAPGEHDASTADLVARGREALGGSPQEVAKRPETDRQ